MYKSERALIKLVPKKLTLVEILIFWKLKILHSAKKRFYFYSLDYCITSRPGQNFTNYLHEYMFQYIDVCVDVEFLGCSVCLSLSLYIPPLCLCCLRRPPTLDRPLLNETVWSMGSLSLCLLLLHCVVLKVPYLNT